MILPKRVQLYTVSKCQLNCEFCPKSCIDIPNINMSMDNFKRYVMFFLENGIKEFELSPLVGEILLDKHFIERVKFLYDNGAEKIFAFTNLIALNMEILIQLTQYPKFQFYISIYGNTPEIYKKRTNADLKIFKIFEKNYLMLYDFLSLMKKYNKSTFKIGEINNRYELNSYKTPITALNLKFKISNLCESFNNFPTDYNWSTKLINVNEHIIEEVKKERIDKTSGICRNLIDDIGVRPDGTVGICGSWFDINDRMIIGNINNMTFDNIFGYYSTFQKIIKEQKNGKYRSLCRHCDFLSKNEDAIYDK